MISTQLTQLSWLVAKLPGGEMTGNVQRAFWNLTEKAKTTDETIHLSLTQFPNHISEPF